MRARVIAGRTVSGTAGPVSGVATDPLYLDVTLPEDATFDEPVPSTHNAFVYVFEGGVSIEAGDSVTVAAGTLAALGPGERVRIAGRDRGGRFLLIAGRRLGEPVARAGPFVMNTRQEVMDAFQEFREGRF